MNGALPAAAVAATFHPAAAASLVVMVVSAVLFTVGWRLVAAGRRDVHCRLQTATAILNAAVVVFWMVRSYVLYVLPEIPARLDERAYALTTLHAVVGVVGVVVGLFVVVSARGLVPRALRIRRFKPFMRSAYALYLLSTLTGVVVYVVVYVRAPG